MIKSFTITNYFGDSITLELTRPEDSGFIIRSVDGLSPVKSIINTTELSTNDGSLFNSARLGQRNIVFDLQFMMTKFDRNIEDVRQRSYKYFPIKKQIEIMIETDNRKLKTTGYVESNTPNIFSAEEGTQISVICPDPYFYSAGDDGKNLTVFYGVESMFEFPYSNESITTPLTIFGEIQNRTEKTVYYEGDADIGITIRIVAIGEVVNLTIYNTRTKETMKLNTTKLRQLTGSGIIKGDVITIVTLKGNKSISLLRNGKTYNILNCLTKDSDWLVLSRGDNIFAFSAEQGTSNLEFIIENEVIYEGI